MTLPRLAAVSLFLSLWSSLAAHADGTFFQLDVGASTQTVVGSMTRGAFSVEANASHYEDGHNVNMAATYGLPVVGGPTVKIGPSLGWSDEDDLELGAKLSVQRYVPTGFGGAYILADANSVNRSWFLLAQLSHAPSGFGIELSRGGSDSYRETTLVAQKRISEGPFSLRAGYKFDADEIFAGFSINTF